MKVFSIFSIIFLAGLATTFAAPAEDGKATLKGYITTFLRQIGLMDDDPCIGFCYNGGNCKLMPDGEPECSCPDGFDGQHCEFVDLCEFQDCNQHGICQNNDSEEGYTCFCEPGFAGAECENEDYCYPNPCKHDGICKPDPTDQYPNGTMCDCLDGYYGPTCDIVDQCRTDPCANGGTCSLDEHYEKHCDCTPTFKGDNCELPVECDPACVNGICAENHNGKAMCFCQPGYSGIICDRSVCDPNPCFNGGVCSVSHEGKFNCTCPAGFDGDKCQINPCNPDEFTTDCNHGYCEVDQNSGEPGCTCFEGWEDQGQEECTKKKDEPTEPTEEPTEPTEKPTEPTEEPTEPTEEPTEPTEKPTEPTEEPTEPTEKPTETTEAPTEPTEEPTQPTEPPIPGPCNVIDCSSCGFNSHCTGDCIFVNGDEQCECEPGFHGDKCKDEDFWMA